MPFLHPILYSAVPSGSPSSMQSNATLIQLSLSILTSKRPDTHMDGYILQILFSEYEKASILSRLICPVRIRLADIRVERISVPYDS
jgi:hypothetical protein